MKNFALLLLILIIFSCRHEESPRPVAEKFLNAMNVRNYNEAKKYSTAETIKLLKQLERIEELNKITKETTAAPVKIVSEDIRGNSAIVYFREDGLNTDQKITLRKIESRDENGTSMSEWKVSLRKEEINMPVWPNSPDSLKRIAS